jgi:hypothetical protein
MITRKMFVDNWKWWTFSLRYFLQSPFSFSVQSPDTSLSTLLSNTLWLCSPVSVTGHFRVSIKHRENYRLLLYILVDIFLHDPPLYILLIFIAQIVGLDVWDKIWLWSIYSRLHVSIHFFCRLNLFAMLFWIGPIYTIACYNIW